MKKRVLIAIIEITALLLAAFAGFAIGVDNAYDMGYTDGYCEGYEQGAVYGANEMDNYYQSVLKNLGLM